MSTLTDEKLIYFILEEKILKLGEFTTNSGRKSPYFCNFGDLCDPLKLEVLASRYADKIIEAFGSQVDNVFGPSYKGITLAIMTSYALSKKLCKKITFTFNRKEAKDHGEKGLLIGHVYEGSEKVVIVEDVLTSGKSLKSAIELLEKKPCEVLGSVVCVDRQELDLHSNIGAKKALESETNLPVYSLLRVEDILKILSKNAPGLLPIKVDQTILSSIRAYQEKYFS